MKNTAQRSACNHPSVFILAAVAVLNAVTPAASQDHRQDPDSPDTLFLISPLFGYNRDELKRRDSTGRIRAEVKTAPEYGLFAVAAHPRLTANNFLFFTEAAGHTEVMGNFFHVNLYGDPAASLTWNVGAGHLYHKIEPRNESIEVQVPLVKVGPLWRIEPWRVAVNPYIGYAWERVETRRGAIDNDSRLYGISVDWRWRMIGLNAKYYRQDSRELADDFDNIHLRLTAGFTRHWGAVVRFDHVEHATTEDTSVLVGPVYVF